MRLSLLLIHAGWSAAVFTGMGEPMQSPVCAYACGNSLSSAPLSCSMMDHSGGHMMAMTAPDCRAHNEAYLTSVAYCIESKCGSEVPVWEIEKYWVAMVTTSPTVPPMWDYRSALEHVNGIPSIIWTMGLTLNETMLAPEKGFQVQSKFIPVMFQNSAILYKYALIILIVGFATPIVMTVLTYLPLTSAIINKLKPYLIWPSSVGSYHVRPLPFSLGNAPTMGQMWYILGFFIINIILSCVAYVLMYPLSHPWGYDHRGEILAYAGYRTGEFAFALLPLVILFAGRNNILLWITNWSHSTFLLLHRWVARLFALHTILHSVFLWAARVQTGTYSADVKLPYWIWGIVGTLFVCLMLVFAMLWARQLSYEVFLIGHIIMAVFVLVGSWEHLVLRFGYGGNHEYWLYAAAAVWIFDRGLRIVRIIKNGARRSTVTAIGPNHVRVDIYGVRFNGKPGYHGYIYFPTLSPFKPWENHPFSVNSMAILHHYKHSSRSESDSVPDASTVEKRAIETTTKGSNGLETDAVTSGITLIIRKSKGMTKLLQSNARLLTLIDGPYHNNHTGAILKCDRLLLIGGGIGITGLLGFLTNHINVKLAWGVNESASAVVAELDSVLASVIDKEIKIGERLDVDALLRQEVRAGYNKVGVVVCGPGGLCDSVRAKVSAFSRHEKTRFELEVDAFSW